MVSFIGSAILSGIGEAAITAREQELKKQEAEKLSADKRKAALTRAQFESDQALLQHRRSMEASRESAKFQSGLIGDREEAADARRVEETKRGEGVTAALLVDELARDDELKAALYRHELDKITEKGNQDRLTANFKNRRERLIERMETKQVAPISRIGISSELLGADTLVTNEDLTKLDIIKEIPGINYSTTTFVERSIERAEHDLSAVQEKNWGETEADHLKTFNTLPTKLQQRLAEAVTIKFNAVKKGLRESGGYPDTDILRFTPKMVGLSPVESSIMNGVVLNNLRTQNPELRDVQDTLTKVSNAPTFSDTVAGQGGPLNMENSKVRKALYANPTFVDILNNRASKNTIVAAFNNPANTFPEVSRLLGTDNMETLQNEVFKILTDSQAMYVRVGGGPQIRVASNFAEVDQTTSRMGRNRQLLTAQQVGSTGIRGATALADPNTITSVSISSLSSTLGGVLTAADDFLQTFFNVKQNKSGSVPNPVEFVQSQLIASTPETGFTAIKDKIEELAQSSAVVNSADNGVRKDALAKALRRIEKEEKIHLAAQKKLAGGSLDEKERMNVITTQLFNIQRTAFTFQLASLLQGGASGNSVSTQDFERVFESLWGVVGNSEAERKTALFVSFANGYIIKEQIVAEIVGAEKNVVKASDGKPYDTTHSAIKTYRRANVEILQDLLSSGSKTDLIKFYSLIGVTIPPEVIGLNPDGTKAGTEANIQPSYSSGSSSALTQQLTDSFRGEQSPDAKPDAPKPANVFKRD